MGKIVSLREFARANRISVGTVQHYIEKGILTPKEIVVKGYDLADYEKIAAHRLREKPAKAVKKSAK